MKNYSLILSLLLTASLFSEEGRLGRESNEYKYSSIGIDLIQTEETGIGAKISIPLPGPLYTIIERRAEGVDTENESYDRIINGVRLGAQSGIGDLISNISAEGVNIGVKNIFDVYAELGVKSVAIDGKMNSFSEDDAQAHLVAGLRFGNSNNWEGKIFIDFSKESEVVQKRCNVDEVCIQEEIAVVEYILNEETDRKFGAGVLYNINKRSAFSIELTSSKVFESSFKLGYQINF
jgi:hypothetical protein